MKKSGLLETVAEYMQHIYVLERIKPEFGMNQWMENHMNAGNFPGWGYAGGKILSNYGTDAEKYFTKIFEKSSRDWREAYSLINALEVFSN